MHPFLRKGNKHKYLQYENNHRRTVIAADPRTFLIKQCSKTRAGDVGETTDRKDFFKSLGKAGKIDALNNSALGTKVGVGLRSLTKVSNLVRTGEKSSTDASVPQDGTAVLAETGISQGQTAQAASFNPGAVNAATAQASSIADRVKAGNFDVEDIPGSFADIQNLSTIVDGIFVGGNNDSRDLELCAPSNYAKDLIAYAPKFKFLFVVEFVFTEEFSKKINGRESAFVIKQSSRPTVNFEHEEINMYNFWVKVPKRTSYEPMTMRFYDDNKNAAMRLYESYLKAVSPIANMAFGQSMEDRPSMMESQSMGFQSLGANDVNGGLDTPFKAHPYTASFGPVGNDENTKNVFKRINLYHIYDYGAKMNSYRFFNPKVIALELDDLDMADSGNGSEMSFQFAYDAVGITLDVPLSDKKYSTKLKDMTDMGQHPIEPNFGGDYKPEGPAGDPDAGGGFFSSVGAVAGTVTGAISGVIDAGEGIVSNAFQATSDFAGSIFSEVTAGASAASASAKNAISGDVGKDK